jgi:hypothetical protein
VKGKRCDEFMEITGISKSNIKSLSRDIQTQIDNFIGSNFPIKQTDKFHPYHAQDENGITHWWLQDELGNKLDVTIDQFLSEDRHPQYVTGRKGWFLTKQPSKRSKELMSRVLSDLK